MSETIEETLIKHMNHIGKLTKQRDALLDACKELVRFCESKERLSQDDVCPTKAYELSKAAIKQCRG